MTLRWSQRAWEWLPLLAWMAIIFITSGQTKQELPSFGVWDYLVKKAGHFVAYGVLAWLAWRVTRGWQRPFTGRSSSRPFTPSAMNSTRALFPAVWGARPMS